MTMIEIIEEYNKTLNKDLLKDIIEYFNPIIRDVINRYKFLYSPSSYAYTDEDLYNVCITSMIKAIKKYDSTKGSKITTYVYSYCKEYCKRYIKQQTKDIPIEDEYITISEPPYDIDLKIEIQDLLRNTLTPLEIKVIHLHYGFNDSKTYTFEEMNALLKVKSSFYIHKKAINKLRQTDYIKNFPR